MLSVSHFYEARAVLAWRGDQWAACGNSPCLRGCPSGIHEAKCDSQKGKKCLGTGESGAMPTLKEVAECPAALNASIERMCDPSPIREEVKLNHGIRSVAELRTLVCGPAFENGTEVSDAVDAFKNGGR